MTATWSNHDLTRPARQLGKAPLGTHCLPLRPNLSAKGLIDMEGDSVTESLYPLTRHNL